MEKNTEVWKYQVISGIGNINLTFPNSNLIRENFSQAFQDLFVLKMLGGKKHGTYLEIGANHPTFHSNTFLLHSIFDWEGISIEFDSKCFVDWPHLRPKSNFLISDALIIDYKKALNFWFPNSNRRVDYLQLDIDPSINTLTVLKRLPLDDFRFTVITFETDAYTGDLRARDESRKLLNSYGYRLLGPDVSVVFKDISQNPIAFEDWWIDPLEINIDEFAFVPNTFEKPLFPQKLIRR